MSSRPNISFRMTGDLVVNSSKLFTSKIEKGLIHSEIPNNLAPIGSAHSPFAVRFQYLYVFHRFGERLKLKCKKCDSKCKFGT